MSERVLSNSNMRFKDHHESFYFLHDLSKKLKFENKLEASDHLNYFLERRTASISTEAMGIMVIRLKDFTSNYPKSVINMERKKLSMQYRNS
jgi:hypothetical protein